MEHHVAPPQPPSRLVKAFQVCVIAACVVMPMLFGYAAISVANDLNSLNKHEAATALCLAINTTDRNIQGFVIDLSNGEHLTVKQSIALQRQLDARFPQYDCSNPKVLEPIGVPTTLPPVK